MHSDFNSNVGMKFTTMLHLLTDRNKSRGELTLSLVFIYLILFNTSLIAPKTSSGFLAALMRVTTPFSA